MAHEHEHDDDYDVHVHITPVKTYAAILGALLFLTGLTVLAYNVKLGELNLAVAILIAVIKSSLVITWFMHLKHDTKFHATVFLGSLAFIGVFLAYTMNDTMTRSQVDPDWGSRIDRARGGYVAGSAPGLIEQGAEGAPLPNIPLQEFSHEAELADDAEAAE